VRARADVHFAGDFANFSDSAVIWSLAFVKNSIAHNFFFGCVKSGAKSGALFRAELRSCGCFFQVSLAQVGGAAVHVFFAVGLVQDSFQAGFDAGAGLCNKLRIQNLQLDFLLLLADFARHALLQFHDTLNSLVGQLQRFHHQVFTDFLRAAFHHQNGIACAGYAQIKR